MKKVIVFFILAICFANFSFGESRETQIANSIEKARYVNYLMGIKDPNKIKPGQYIFVPILAKKGDTEWWIYDKVLPLSAVSPDTTINSNDVIPAVDPENKIPQKYNLWDFIKSLPWWVWFIIILIISAIIGGIISENQKNEDKKSAKFSADPTKEGKPFVPGGVNNENQAGAHFVSIARASNPSLDPNNVLIKEKKRVYVSTPNGESAVVEFADGSKESLSFQNVPGWVAMVSTDGGKNFKREVFFQDCGNPVYSRTSMRDSGLIITEEPIKFGNTENENSAPTVTEEKIETADKKVVEAGTKVLEEKQTSDGSETFRLQMKMMEIGEKAAEKGNLHSLVFDLKPDGSLKAAVNFKAPELHQEKKNEKTGTEGKDK